MATKKTAAAKMAVKRVGKPIRQRKAKADGSIGTLQKTIEKNYGLPTGSIKIVYPSGRKARIDADVGALRTHWETRG
ncbi:MAG TPA: hypothetical protein VMR06_11990 [Dokdonella sp.]|uniref:hypothetical protein n=1 Tax=Dokdonella sp. TaxID=2291710 RepID=UPI002C5166C8|nr:hypothetical protein [Dokdonella sp.]HUD42700.1 hypothetical protein [Dokdonella sp.]